MGKKPKKIIEPIEGASFDRLVKSVLKRTDKDGVVRADLGRVDSEAVELSEEQIRKVQEHLKDK